MTDQAAEIKRELLCEGCGERVAVSPTAPGVGEPPNLAEDWHALSDTTTNEFGAPVCKCGEPMTWSILRVRAIP